MKDLLRKLFDGNDDNRITAAEALKHEWIENTNDNVAPKLHRQVWPISNIQIPIIQSTIESMQSFNAKRKLKAAMTAVMTANILARSVGWKWQYFSSHFTITDPSFYLKPTFTWLL